MLRNTPSSHSEEASHERCKCDTGSSGKSLKPLNNLSLYKTINQQQQTLIKMLYLDRKPLCGIEGFSTLGILFFSLSSLCEVEG